MNGIDAERALERLNVARTKYVLDHGGKFLPVVNLFDSDGTEVVNLRDASRCVCYDESLPGDKWVVIWNILPGEISEKSQC